MVSRRITETGDEAADAVASAGRATGARARRAAAGAGDAIERGSAAGAARMRRAARSAADAYDEASDDVEGRVASLEETIRRNPLAAAGAAVLIGVVLGRFVL